MRYFLIFFLVILATSSLTLGQGTGKETGAAQEVKEAIAKYREALLQRDTAALDRIWADDYLFANAQGGLLDKAQRLVNIKTGATRFDAIKSHEDSVRVRVYGDVVVVNSHVVLEGQHSGQKTSGQYRSLHVWVKLDGRWQMVTNQITKIVPP